MEVKWGRDAIFDTHHFPTPSVRYFGPAEGEHEREKERPGPRTVGHRHGRDRRGDAELRPHLEDEPNAQTNLNFARHVRAFV